MHTFARNTYPYVAFLTVYNCVYAIYTHGFFDSSLTPPSCPYVAFHYPLSRCHTLPYYPYLYGYLVM